MSRRILVVEDQEDNRRILHDLLTNVGYEIVQAENGVEALRVAAAERPDLILWTSSYRCSTAMRRRATSRPTLGCAPFPSS